MVCGINSLHILKMILKANLNNYIYQTYDSQYGCRFVLPENQKGVERK